MASYITLQHHRRASVQNTIVFHFSIPARKTSFHAFGHFVVSHGIERLLQKYIFSNSQATLHSFFTQQRTAIHFIQIWHAWTNQICLRSFRRMTAHLVWFIGSQRENYVNWNLRPLLVFVMIHLFLSSVALSTMQFTTFFLDGGSYFFNR